MKQKKENRVALLLHWAGGQKSGCSWHTAGYVRWALYHCPVYRDLQADGRHI